MTFNILLIIAATVVVFLILREVICWYFKINERVKLQVESNANQLKIIDAINDIETLKLPKHYNCRSVIDKRTEQVCRTDTDGVKRYN
jgi:ABC-type bacteriocin/lantibiotic exporter with double-glycine peptidase domain